MERSNREEFINSGTTLLSFGSFQFKIPLMSTMVYYNVECIIKRFISKIRSEGSKLYRFTKPETI